MQDTSTLYLSRSQVRELLGITNQNLTYWLKKCKITSHRLGTSKEQVIHRDAVREMVKQFEERKKFLGKGCQHKNVAYTEYMQCEDTWTFEDGKLAADPNPILGIDTIETVKVFCFDCMLEKTYRLAQAPKWVKQLRKQVIDRGLTWKG